MNDAEIRILIIEDNAGDVRLIREYLSEKRDTPYSLTHASCLKDGLDLLLLHERTFDVIFLDLGLPDSMGLSTLTAVQTRAQGIPIIILTGLNDEATAIEAMGQGAQDYLEKGEIDGRILWRVMQYSIQRIQMEQKLRENENRYRELFNNSGDCVAMYAAIDNGNDFVFTDLNRAGEKVENIKREDVIGKRVRDIFPAVEEFGILQSLRRVWTTGVPERIPVSFYQDNRISGWRENYIYRLQTGEVIAVYSDVTERIHGEKAIRDSERQYRLLIENIPSGVTIVQKGVVVFTNPQVEKLTGYTLKDLGTIDPFIVIDSADRDRVKGYYAQRLQGMGGPDRYEVRIRKKDGALLWVDRRVVEIEWQGGSAILIIDADITERKTAEESREEDATRHRILIEQSRDGIVVINQDGFVREVNETFAEMIGYSQEEALHLRISDWEYLTPINELSGILRNVDEKGQYFETRHRRKNGTIYDVGISVNGAVFGDEKLIFCICRDITERKKMEEENRENEEKFSEIFYTNPYPMVIIAPNGGYINDLNEAFTEASGYTREECLDKPIMELGFWMKNGEEIDLINTLLNQENIQYLEADMQTKAGEIRNVLLSTKTITISGLPFIIISSDDVTERKKMQEQLIVTDRLASVGELAAGIAHELNNPLTGVIGFSDLLKNRDDLPADILEDIDLINREAVRASLVARHLLTFARRHPDEKRPVNINDIIRLVLELRAYEQNVSNITIINHMSADLPLVAANGFQLQQVFFNIIINAEHFMTEEHGRGRLEIITKRAGDMVRITFSDDGPGIRPENIKKIFDPFYTSKEVGKGTGLGLSICYGIIVEHGGRIWAESVPNQGATFIIELPVFEGDDQETGE